MAGARFLVIGASGQLGTALCAALGRAGEVVATGHRHAAPPQRALDLGDEPAVVRLLDETKPDVIVVAGAYTNVEAAETDRETCTRVNVDAPVRIGEYAQRAGATVVYFSTDYIFDGGTPTVTEDDPARPLNVYGETKRAGEVKLAGLLPDRHLILRTTGVYGPDRERRNFVLRLLDNLGRTTAPIRVASDQWGTPTFTDDIAAVTATLLAQRRSGTFHAAGPDYLPRSELARHICRRFGFDPGRIIPTPTADLQQAARRPFRVRLGTDKLGALGLASFRGVDEGLASLRAWQEGGANGGAAESVR